LAGLLGIAVRRVDVGPDGSYTNHERAMDPASVVVAVSLI
jgi:hypothetical protein